MRKYENLFFELFEKSIFVRAPSDFHFESFVPKRNRSNSETFENRSLTVRVFLLLSVSLVQVNLSLELVKNRIFVRGPNDFHLEFFVRKPNCSNSETFENRGLTVFQLQELLFTKPFACHVRAYGVLHWARVCCVVHP